MKSNNTKQVVQDLILNKPTATINTVVYNWGDDTATVEVIFQEENARFKHSRNFVMHTGGRTKTDEEITNFIKQELKDFNQ